MVSRYEKVHAVKRRKETHQVGHDVMVAFDMFPDTDDLRGGGAEINVNLTGLQHSIR